MAGPYYCDSAGSNTSPYDTWAKAATSLQTVLDLAVAGEIIYFRGTQTLAATLDVDTNSGTNAGGWIKLIGCNASGNVDGTRAVIDANGGSYHAVTWAGMDMCWWENIEVKNTAAGNYDGISFTASTAAGNVYVNCSFHNCGRHGIYTQGMDLPGTYWRCIFYSNGSSGASITSTVSRMFFCRAYSNTAAGFVGHSSLSVGCLAYDNGDDGWSSLGPYGVMLNCVSDSNDDDGISILAGTSLYAAMIVGCRITNQSGSGDTGIACASEPLIVGYNVFDNNADHLYQDTIIQKLPIEGGTTDSNEYYSENAGEAEGTLQGYTSDSDYNLTSTADLRRDAITLPTA